MLHLEICIQIILKIKNNYKNQKNKNKSQL